MRANDIRPADMRSEEAFEVVEDDVEWSILRNVCGRTKEESCLLLKVVVICNVGGQYTQEEE